MIIITTQDFNKKRFASAEPAVEIVLDSDVEPLSLLQAHAAAAPPDELAAPCQPSDETPSKTAAPPDEPAAPCQPSDGTPSKNATMEARSSDELNAIPTPQKLEHLSKREILTKLSDRSALAEKVMDTEYRDWQGMHKLQPGGKRCKVKYTEFLEQAIPVKNPDLEYVLMETWKVDGAGGMSDFYDFLWPDILINCT